MRTTLRFSVWDVSTRLACAAECSAGGTVAPTSGAFSSVVASFAPAKTKLTKGSLTNDTLAPAGWSVERAPISNERKPKPNAKSHSPRGPRKETSGIPARNLSDHPRHRLTTRVTSNGPRAAYKRAAKRSAQPQGVAPEVRTGITSLNLGSHKAIMP